MKPKVLIVMGSDSDMPIMEETGKILNEFGISYEMTIASAHRSPERTAKLAREAEKRDRSNYCRRWRRSTPCRSYCLTHNTPVIGVPINSSPLQGFESLLSMGPNATRSARCYNGSWKGGCKNAAILAAEIIGRKDARIVKKAEGI